MRWSLIIAGMAIAAGLLCLPLTRPRPGSTGAFLILFTLIFLAYFQALRVGVAGSAAGFPVRPTIRLILLFAALFRLTLLFAPPALSTDATRYLWDGRVVAAGENPYLEPPSSPGLERLRDENYQRLEHREVRTIYPPAAQALFAIAAASGAGVTGLKALFVLADLLLIVVLCHLLRLRGQPPARALIYAWNPLVVIEVAWSGHLEPVGVALMLLAAVAIIQKRDVASSLALGAAGLIKLIPFLLLAPFGRSMRARAVALLPFIVLAAYWPFRDAGHHLVGGLRAYAGHWIANESLFGLIHAAIAWIDPTPLLKGAIAFLRAHIPGSAPLDRLYTYVYPMDLARALCAAIVVGFAAGLYIRRVEPLRGAFLVLAALLLLSPTVHPWYLLWVLPFVALFPSWAWIVLTWLMALSYVNLGAAGRSAEPYAWIGWAIYLPFYSLLALEWFRRRPRFHDGARVAVAARPVEPVSPG